MWGRAHRRKALLGASPTIFIFDVFVFALAPFFPFAPLLPFGFVIERTTNTSSSTLVGDERIRLTAAGSGANVAAAAAATTRTGELRRGDGGARPRFDRFVRGVFDGEGGPPPFDGERSLFAAAPSALATTRARTDTAPPAAS